MKKNKRVGRVTPQMVRDIYAVILRYPDKKTPAITKMLGRSLYPDIPRVSEDIVRQVRKAKGEWDAYKLLCHGGKRKPKAVSWKQDPDGGFSQVKVERVELQLSRESSKVMGDHARAMWVLMKAVDSRRESMISKITSVFVAVLSFAMIVWVLFEIAALLSK